MAGLACSALLAQNGSIATAPPKDAQIAGQVLNDASQNPLQRARVSLRSLAGGNSTIVVDVDDRGAFVIKGIRPGRYTLEASRDGYLSSNVGYRGALRMPTVFYLAGGDDVTDMTFRLKAWGVVAGRIRYGDGEPGVGLKVEIYRAYRVRGRLRYQLAVTGGTDDRGSYRIYGLPPGNYYVAAIYEKDPTAPQVTVQRRVDSSGKELPVYDYTTTFYPDTTRLDEAVPVHVAAGQEVGGVDVFLKEASRVRIRGHVTSGISGGKLRTATIILYRYSVDSQSGMAAPWRAIFDSEGDFIIRDVPPGNYEVVVQATDGGGKLEGFTPLLVANEDIDNLEVLADRDATWKGTFVVEGGKALPPNSDPQVRVEPRSEFHGGVSPSVSGLGFSFPMADGETYDVFVDNLPDDFYVSGISVGGNDLRTLGITPSMASETPLKIALNSNGGVVSGRVFGPNNVVWSGAALGLLPEFSVGALQSYRFGSADEYGIFHIRGVPPGKYTMIAWFDDPPCDVYDPVDRDVCRGVGQAVEVTSGGEQVFELRVKDVRK
jgi:hypothetical protein